MKLADRIMAKSIPEPNSGCWLWLGAVNGQYGVIRDDTGKISYVHRSSFQVFNRILEDHELACHRCDMPLCVNPEHMFAGTHKDNHYDAMEKGRWSHGEIHGMAVLTEAQVVSIREIYSEGARTDDIAYFYGISSAHIRKIVSGKAWKHAAGNTIVNRRKDVILTPERVELLRSMKGSNTPRKQIAADFGVSLPTVYAIWSGRLWKNSTLNE